MVTHFAQRGIDADRLDFRHERAPGATHLAIYHAIDIALDALPWSGHTTACESLYMGVPFVTQLGNVHAGRMAASMLHHAGFADWIARDDEDYVRIAVALAGNVNRLAELRASMREKFVASPVCDARAFAASFERTLRHAWQQWCNTRYARG